jgi:hypothetical protein
VWVHWHRRDSLTCLTLVHEGRPGGSCLVRLARSLRAVTMEWWPVWTSDWGWSRPTVLKVWGSAR